MESIAANNAPAIEKNTITTRTTNNTDNDNITKRNGWTETIPSKKRQKIIPKDESINIHWNQDTKMLLREYNPPLLFLPCHLTILQALYHVPPSEKQQCTSSNSFTPNVPTTVHEVTLPRPIEPPHIVIMDQLALQIQRFLKEREGIQNLRQEADQIYLMLVESRKIMPLNTGTSFASTTTSTATKVAAMESHTPLQQIPQRVPFASSFKTLWNSTSSYASVDPFANLSPTVERLLQNRYRGLEMQIQQTIQPFLPLMDQVESHIQELQSHLQSIFHDRNNDPIMGMNMNMKSLVRIPSHKDTVPSHSHPVATGFIHDSNTIAEMEYKIELWSLLFMTLQQTLLPTSLSLETKLE